MEPVRPDRKYLRCKKFSRTNGKYYAITNYNDSKTIADQREYFWTLSRHLYKVLKCAGFNDYVIYKLPCATSNTFWLGQSRDAANPYLGIAAADGAEVAEALSPLTIQQHVQ
jgi:hypothetical protein